MHMLYILFMNVDIIFTLKIFLVILLSVYRWNSHDVGLENLELDQMIILEFLFSFILITCRLDIVSIF